MTTKIDWLVAAKTSGVTGADRIKLHAKRSAKYKDGMTVAEFLKAGGTRSELVWDRKKAFVTLHSEDTYQRLVKQ